MNAQQDSRRLSLNKGGFDKSNKGFNKPKSDKPAKPAGRKLDGHEHELLSIKREQAVAKVVVKTLSGQTISGELVDFDRFSVTVAVPEIGRQVVFKHAIESFYKVA